MADTLDLLSLAEGKQSINVDDAWDTRQAELERFITAVSRRVDELCGAVVLRAVTGEAHDGGDTFIQLRNAPTSKTSATTITTATEYDQTVATVLAAETNASKPDDAYLFDTHLGFLRRRGGGVDRRFVSGRRNVVVDYNAGRYANTAAVDAKFKVAADTILRRLWTREAGAWARGGDPFADAGQSPGFFKAVDPMIREFLADEIRVVH